MKAPKGYVARLHDDAKCADGPNCHGPGCKVETGKTARKRTRRNNAV